MPEGQGTYIRYVFLKVLFQNKVTYGHDDHSMQTDLQHLQFFNLRMLWVIKHINNSVVFKCFNFDVIAFKTASTTLKNLKKKLITECPLYQKKCCQYQTFTHMMMTRKSCMTAHNKHLISHDFLEVIVLKNWVWKAKIF